MSLNNVTSKISINNFEEVIKIRTRSLVDLNQGNPQALPILPILPIGYFFFNEIPKLGQMFLFNFPFLGVLRRDYSYGVPDQGVTSTVDFLASLSA